jgi:hypothetical protein
MKQKKTQHNPEHFELTRETVPFRSKLRFAMYRYRIMAERSRIKTIIRFQRQARSLKNWQLQQQNNILVVALVFALSTIVALISRPDIAQSISDEIRQAVMIVIDVLPKESAQSYNKFLDAS